MDCLDIAFENFSKTAVRVETLPEYCIYDTAEFEEFKNFISNKPINGFANQSWLNDIEKWVKENKEIIRIRIIPEKLSEYYLYESNWCYPKNRKAGETIKFVSEKQYKALSKKYGIYDDFWIFDSCQVIILKYNVKYEFDKAIEVSDKERNKYLLFFNELRELALS